LLDTECGDAMIRECMARDFDVIFSIINEAAQAYKGVIPDDCWHEPYMSRATLEREINAGISFWGFEQGGELIGIMGIQPVRDVTLIRHAYIKTANQKQGVGGTLLSHLRGLATQRILIGTWADASWAIRFYENHGFRMVDTEEKNRLLKTYWSITDRQVETSVVLADTE